MGSKDEGEKKKKKRVREGTADSKGERKKAKKEKKKKSRKEGSEAEASPPAELPDEGTQQPKEETTPSKPLPPASTLSPPPSTLPTTAPVLTQVKDPPIPPDLLRELQEKDPDFDWEKPLYEILNEEYRRLYAHQNRKKGLHLQQALPPWTVALALPPGLPNPLYGGFPYTL